MVIEAKTLAVQGPRRGRPTISIEISAPRKLIEGKTNVKDKKFYKVEKKFN